MTARLVKGAALVAAPALGMPALAEARRPSITVPAEIAAALGLSPKAEIGEALTAIAGLQAGAVHSADSSAADDVARRLGIDPKLLTT